jgi:hypothetical protein
MNKGELRIKYAPHLFEIKEGLFLNEENIGSLMRAIEECEKRNHKFFIWKERHFELGYAKFCVQHYENVDPSFDEQAIEYEAKKKELQEKAQKFYLKNMKK